MKPRITKAKAITPPSGPIQTRILAALKGKRRGLTAQEITDTLNKEPDAPSTTLASVRDTLYRRLVGKGHVVKGPVSFRLPGSGKGE